MTKPSWVRAWGLRVLGGECFFSVDLQIGLRGSYLHPHQPAPAQNPRSPAHCNVLLPTPSNPTFVPHLNSVSIQWKDFVKNRSQVMPLLSWKPSTGFPCTLKKALPLTFAYRILDFCFPPLSHTFPRSRFSSTCEVPVSVLQPLPPPVTHQEPGRCWITYGTTTSILRNLSQRVLHETFCPPSFQIWCLILCLFALWTGHPMHSFKQDPDSLSNTTLLHTSTLPGSVQAHNLLHEHCSNGWYISLV